MNSISHYIRNVPMTLRVIVALVSWLVFISSLHHGINADNETRPIITMGYMPVISNMAVPILDHASITKGEVRFRALKFASFTEMAESLRHGDIDAAFMIAPLSIVLRQQKEDVKVVLIGNRNESTLVTQKSQNITDFKDLVGKTVAVPMRFSGHNLSIRDSMEKYGLSGKINIVEMNPPDMASALASGALDAYYVGEPFAAQTLKSGHAKLLHYAEQVWPKFFSNLVLVRQQWISKNPELMQQFAGAVAHAGRWAKNNPDTAAEIAAAYWNQSVELVKYAMNTPPGRILYDDYIPKKQEMQYIADLLLRFNLLKSNDISGLIDDSFAKAVQLKPQPTLDDLLNMP